MKFAELSSEVFNDCQTGVNSLNELSVVIPVGPDDQAWRQLLDELGEFGQALEIIFSACQASPADIKLPENAKWLNGSQGRARQLNAGARQASRALIWFLHADTRLTREVFAAVQHYIETGSGSLGYFKLKFAGDGPGQTRLNAWAANTRSRLLGLPFGDQGFIINKTAFEQLNGFDETVALGEDLDFVVRWQAAGFPLQELPAELMTSARRYRQHGWLSTTVRHVYLTWLLTRLARRRLALGL